MMRSVLGLGAALLCIGLTAAVDIDYVQNPNFENCDADKTLNSGLHRSQNPVNNMDAPLLPS